MAGHQRRAALRTPHVVRVMLTSLVARLPTAMATLALLLLLGPRHGYALAGLGCTLYVGASALTNPIWARLVDRHGARIVLVPVSLVNAAALIAVAVLADHALVGVYLAALVAGAALPPVTAVVRGLWPRILPAEQVPVMFGLEATAQELIYITGPALLALLAAVFGAATALIIAAVVGFVGVIALVSTPVFGPPEPALHTGKRLMLLRSPRLLVWLVVGASLVASFGMTEVAVVAFVAPGKAGGNAVSGFVLAVWSAGSMVGGLAFGRRERIVTDRSVLVATGALTVMTALPALAVDRIMLAALLFAAGVTIAPGLARLYTRISAAAPAAAQTEVFGWLAVGFIVGGAIGSALGGVASAELGARPALALAALPPLVGTAIGVIAHRRLGESAAVEQPPLAGDRPVASRA